MNTSLYITEANHMDSTTNVFYTSNLLFLALVSSQLRDPVGKRGHMSISKLFRIYLLWHCFKGGMCGVSLLGENAQKGGVVVRGLRKTHLRSKTNATTDPERVFGKFFAAV